MNRIRNPCIRCAILKTVTVAAIITHIHPLPGITSSMIFLKPHSDSHDEFISASVQSAVKSTNPDPHRLEVCNTSSESPATVSEAGKLQPSFTYPCRSGQGSGLLQCVPELFIPVENLSEK